jgi:hypothetical protein
LCCFNEGALRGPFGENGPACFTNHKYRICQSLEEGPIGGLRFSTGPIEPRPIPEFEIVNVSCGQTVNMNLYNNTCDNSAIVTLNSGLARAIFGITCTAGGSVDRTGKLPFFDDGARTYTKLTTLTYTAPAQLPDCFTQPTDVVSADAGGTMRHILFRITCAPPQTAAAVFFSPPPGVYSTPIQVVMTSASAGVTIHYTMDGSEPTTASPAVPNGGAVLVDRSLTLRARAFGGGFDPSEITTGIYTIVLQKAAAPVLTPPPGTYSSPISVHMASSTPGAVVRYTVDGSEPSLLSPSSLPLLISTTTTVRARTFAPGFEPSDVVTGTYTIATEACAAAGVFDVLFSVASDPAGHHEVIQLETAVLTIELSSGMAVISGNRPATLTGTGTLTTATCSINAAAFGDVAGRPGVLVEYRNVTVEGSLVTGSYALGTNGALPEGLPIEYTFTGQRR